MEPAEKKSKTIQTILGGIIFTFSMYLAFADKTGDILTMFFAAFGGFLISSSLLKDFFQNIWSKKG